MFKKIWKAFKAGIRHDEKVIMFVAKDEEGIKKKEAKKAKKANKNIARISKK